MTRKETILIAVAVILAGVYLGCFTDSLKEKPIRIEHTVRPNVPVPGRSAPAGRPVKPSAGTLTFSLGREYKLTSVEVVPAAEFQADPRVSPLWHLVGDARSVPTRFIVYGVPLPGMKPSEPGADARPLAPGVEYRLIIKAGRTRGEHDFKITGPAAVGAGGNL